MLTRNGSIFICMMREITLAELFPRCRYHPKIYSRQYKLNESKFQRDQFHGNPSVSMLVEIECLSRQILVSLLFWMDSKGLSNESSHHRKEGAKHQSKRLPDSHRMMNQSLLVPMRVQSIAGTSKLARWWKHWRGTKGLLVHWHATPNTPK